MSSTLITSSLSADLVTKFRFFSAFTETSSQVLSLKLQSRSSRFAPVCSSNPSKSFNSQPITFGNKSSVIGLQEESSSSSSIEKSQYNVGVGNPSFLSTIPPAKLSLSDQAFFLLAFIACTTSVAFTSLVLVSVPTIYAMGRAAASLAKLADTAREELRSSPVQWRPSDSQAWKLGQWGDSSLPTLVCGDGILLDRLHTSSALVVRTGIQEITDGVTKSAQAVQAAEAGIRQIGSFARKQTVSMIQERASLPIISLQPVVAGAAKKTSRAVGHATKSVMNFISRREFSSEIKDDNAIDRLDI
ncbi:hypothetical protein RJ641_023361 [Dillenia turbinata]|uniref:Uncharacterized protein n=1 Tax=Dillenia turbinata TaxID=194707 RepID=A0AAN8YVJ6_9MAGN